MKDVVILYGIQFGNKVFRKAFGELKRTLYNVCAFALAVTCGIEERLFCFSPLAEANKRVVIQSALVFKQTFSSVPAKTHPARLKSTRAF